MSLQFGQTSPNGGVVTAPPAPGGGFAPTPQPTPQPSFPQPSGTSNFPAPQPINPGGYPGQPGVNNGTPAYSPVPAYPGTPAPVPAPAYQPPPTHPWAAPPPQQPWPAQPTPGYPAPAQPYQAQPQPQPTPPPSFPTTIAPNPYTAPQPAATPFQGQPQPGVPQVPAAGQSFSLRDQMARAGYQYQDDSTAWAALQQQITQVAQENTQLRQRMSGVQQPQAAPQAPLSTPGQPAPQQRPGGWNKPQLDPNIAQRVVRDDKGNLVPKDGLDWQAVRQVEGYLQWQAETEKKFWDNPIETLKPGLEEVVSQQVEQRIRAFQAQQAQAQELGAIKGELDRFAFVKDQSGQTVMDPSGQPVLTQHGQIFRHYVAQAQAAGWDTRQQFDYARASAERDLLRMQVQQGQAAPPPAASQQVPLATPPVNALQIPPGASYHPPAYGGTVVNAGPPGNPAAVPQNPQQGLQQMLSAALAHRR